MGFAEQWQRDHKAFNFEGDSGVKRLCRLVHALGYRDFQNYGQFIQDSDHAAYGDLFAFLEDNPGAIQAMVDWIDENHNAFCEAEDCENEVEDGEKFCPDHIGLDEEEG